MTRLIDFTLEQARRNPRRTLHQILGSVGEIANASSPKQLTDEECKKLIDTYETILKVFIPLTEGLAGERDLTVKEKLISLETRAELIGTRNGALPFAYFNLINLYAHLGKQEKAKEYTFEGTKRFPDNKRLNLMKWAYKL